MHACAHTHTHTRKHIHSQTYTHNTCATHIHTQHVHARKHIHKHIHTVFPQDQRMEFLLTELKGKRPLLPPCMETSPDVQEVIATFRYVFTCCVCVQVCLHVYA